MQMDGNLVLYEKTSDTAERPYWDTGTWSLPVAERPTRLTLDGQGQLHLLDRAGAKKWSSGTWGEGYISPFLSMQDSGNLMLVHDTWRPYWATGSPSGAGRIASVFQTTRPSSALTHNTRSETSPEPSPARAEVR